MKNTETAEKLVNGFEKKYGEFKGCSELVVRISALLHKKDLDLISSLERVKSDISVIIDKQYGI